MERPDLGRHHRAVGEVAEVGGPLRPEAEIEGVGERDLLEVRQHEGEERRPLAAPEAARVAGALAEPPDLAGHDHAVDVGVIEGGQADLLEVVGALGLAGRLAGRLHCGQEQGDQQADDGDDD